MWFRRHPIQQLARQARKYEVAAVLCSDQAVPSQPWLTTLGLHTAVSQLSLRVASNSKILTAKQHYPMITDDRWNRARQRLRSKHYGLLEIPLAQYPNVPPLSVLTALETAMGYKCFDRLAIYRVEQLPQDPILVGTITGYSGRFVIAVWGEDIDMELCS